MPTPRARGYCFTINNPSSWDDADIANLVDKAQYVVRGKETGEENTPHYQGYVYFKEKKSFIFVKNIIPRAHIEAQKGSFDEAILYCQKDGDWQEWGSRPRGSGGQADKWKDVLTLARRGKLQEIEDKYPAIFLRYHGKLQSLCRPETPIILENIENEWWYGETGTGKSRELWERFPNHYQKSLNKWWDGYTGQEVVAIEEWAPKNEVTASFLKIWADRYPFSAEIKGGTLQKIRPKKIIVLSNYSIEECFANTQDLGPIKRRFKVKHFVTLG